MLDSFAAVSLLKNSHRRWLTVTVTCCGLLTGITAPLTSATPSLASRAITQAEPRISPSPTPAQRTYDQHMQSGYEATAQRDYPAALTSFEAALSQRANDSYAQLAIQNVSSYLYQQAMQAGQVAEQQEQYEVALVHFQTALAQNSDDQSAQQAVEKLESLLIAQGDPESDDSLPAPNPSNILNAQDPSIWWFILGAAGLLLGIIGMGLSILSFRRRSSDLEKALNNIEQKQITPTEATTSSEQPLVQAETETLPSSPTHLTATVEPDNDVTPPSSVSTAMSTGSVPSVPGALTDPEPPNHTANLSPSITDDADLPIQSITRLSTADTIGELITELAAPEPKKRRKAIWELARKGDSRAMKPLLELMVESDSQDRSLVLEALSQISARTLKPMNQAISLSLQDTNAQVRKNAIRDLTRIYELMAQISRRLSLATDDPDSEVQETARWALSQLNQIPAPPNLESNAESEASHSHNEPPSTNTP